MAAWAWSIATNQAAKLFDRRGPEAAAWYWLKAMRIERTRNNCTRFFNIVQFSGIVLAAVMLVTWLLRK